MARQRIGSWLARLTEVSQHVVVLDVATTSLVSPTRRRRGWWFDVFRDRRMTLLTDWARRTLEMEKPAIVAWTPTAAPVIESISHSRFVYDSLDNWITHPVLRVHRDEAANAYARLLPLADAVVVSAPASVAVLAEWRSDAMIVPNGVDVGRFNRASARPKDLPSSPLVGYAGKLAQRIDVEFITDVASALPDVSFVFLGPIMDRSVTALDRLPNVSLLGDRRPELLPAYVAAFDVAWIPHRVGEGETGGDPIKLYEYWAAKRQVITTPIDGYEAWTRSAFVVQSAREAATTIRGLLNGSVEPKPIELNDDRTWSAIAGRLLDLLDPRSPTAPPASPGRSGA